MRFSAVPIAAILGTFIAAPAPAQSTCGAYDFSGPFVAAWSAGEPFAGAKDAAEKILTLPDAQCHQNMVIAALEQRLGGRAGYKLAATSPALQTQLGLDGPVLGVLFRDSILPDGTTVSVDDGARMIFELDLVARVGDEAINEARTHEEALAAIDAFVPFIELGDLMEPKGVRVTGPLLQAMNARTRFGVAGRPVPVEVSDETIARLATMDARLLDGTGDILVEGHGSALLGHPLDAVLYIVAEAKRRGWRLKRGDLLSLGSFGRFMEASPDLDLIAVYEGLADTPVEVSVKLR